MFRRYQRGFGAITAIMILVILASVGAAMITLSSTQAIGAALDVTATKAYFAAQSGIEWGTYRALQAEPSCEAVTNLGAIDSLAVTVGCTKIASPTNERGTVAIYRIVATACNMPSGSSCPGLSAQANYVERRLVAIIEAPSDNSVQ